MTWTVEDCAIMLQAIAGHDPHDPASAVRPVPNYRAALTGDIKGLRMNSADILVAFLATARWDREKTKEEEKEERRRMIAAIHKELQTNLDFLRELDKEATYAAGQMFLWRDSYQSAINGGKIDMVDPKTQTQIAMVYLQMKQLETYGGKVLAMLGTPVTPESKGVLDFIMNEMKKSIQRTLNIIPRGLEVLEAELTQLDSSPPPGIPPASQSSNPTPKSNRDIDLLKINLAADYRLGWLVAMTGVYFALIVGLLVAWYQKFGSNIDSFYYLGLFLIVGVFGALLVTQELIPYKNWFVLIEEWFKMMENNQRLPELSKLVLQRDRRQSFRRLIFITLVLLDVYLTLLGYPPFLLFVGFTVALVAAGYIIQKLPFT